MSRTKAFSVSINDCRVETFTVGGAGGGGKDTSNTGVRITHPPSGAVGVGRDERSQRQNKVAAFTRMAHSQPFKAWVQRRLAELDSGVTLAQRVELEMAPEKLKVEVRNEEGRWVVE